MFFGIGLISYAARDEGRLRVARYRVLVYRDENLVESLLEFLSRKGERTKVAEHEVVVRAARDESKALGEKPVGESARVLHYLLLICLEFGLQSLAERYSLRRDHVHERTALRAGEYSLVYRLRVFVSAHYHAAAGTSEGLVSRRRDDVRVGHGRGMKSRRDKSRDVSHVYHEERAV